MALNISVHSDLHTEFFDKHFYEQEFSFLQFSHPSNQQDISLDYLFLAGDIGNLKSMDKFFAQLRNTLKFRNTHIFYVLGNHEHYHLTYPDSTAEYYQLCNEYNIHLLDNNVFVDDYRKVLIYGGTLWSNFKLGKNSEQSMKWAAENVYDYHAITYYPNPEYKNIKALIRPKHTQEIFNQTMNKIKDWFTKSEYQDYKKIVVSHFLPLHDCVHKQYTNDIITAYWASHRPDIVRLADIWIYGHSHDNINKDINIDDKIVQLVCNQLGYLQANNLTNYQDLLKTDVFPNGYQKNHWIELDW